MQILEEKEEVVKTSIIKDTLCDKCGKSLSLAYHCAEGTSFTMYFGYGSNKDGCRYTVDLCDDCVDKFLDSLKHPASEE